jgi:hypothetical protein
MNLGQELGRLQLRVEQLEGAIGGDAVPDSGAIAELEAQVRALRAQLAAAQASEVDAKRALAAAQNADIVATVKAECDARIRGKDQQIAELQRKLSEANSLCGALEREVATLRSRPPERVEVPVQAECPTCAPIIAAVAKAVSTTPRPIEPGDYKVGGIRYRIMTLLRETEHPVTSAEIQAALGLSRYQVKDAMHLLREAVDILLLPVGEGSRQGKRGNPGYRYWLASRPLPASITEQGEAQC